MLQRKHPAETPTTGALPTDPVSYVEASLDNGVAPCQKRTINTRRFITKRPGS